MTETTRDQSQPTDPQKRPGLDAIPAQQQDWPGTFGELTPAPDHGEKSWTAHDRLSGKRALVTGADSGIGRAVALLFAQEGADVAIGYLPEEQSDAEDTQHWIESYGRRCVLLPADLRTAGACRDIVEEATRELGGLDVLVCNAAYQMAYDDLQSFPDEQIERTFATNVFAPFWLVKSSERTLASTKGCVIITTSIQAMEPSEHLLDYAASKAALNNLMVNLASQLGEKGIRVNAVAPGPIWTPLIPATMSEDKVEGFGSDTPLGRAGHPVEVAAPYVWLASDEASYVSGTVVGATGGKPIF